MCSPPAPPVISTAHAACPDNRHLRGVRPDRRRRYVHRPVTGTVAAQPRGRRRGEDEAGGAKGSARAARRPAGAGHAPPRPSSRKAPPEVAPAPEAEARAETPAPPEAPASPEAPARQGPQPHRRLKPYQRPRHPPSPSPLLRWRRSRRSWSGPGSGTASAGPFAAGRPVGRPAPAREARPGILGPTGRGVDPG